MGYRSTVRFATTKPGYELMCKWSEEHAAEHNCEYKLLSTDDSHVPEVYLETDTRVVFGWDFIKWDEYMYKDVAAVVQAANRLAFDADATLDIPLEFVRIGEDMNDTEEQYNDAAYSDGPTIWVERDIHVEASSPNQKYAQTFCPECNERLVNAPNYCPNCGAKNAAH